MRKHLEEIPAVVAVFYDLDWDERQWDEKSAECAQRLGIVRSKLAGHDSKLVLVLIQKRAPLPLGEDLNAMERAQALCTKCELLGKNLFVLSHTNLLYGCITRLEGEFHDMASNYYHTRAKKVKSHKDTLNKASHQLLLVRHEFKIAFFGELKKDPALALKHYQQAYTHLLEQRMIDIHMLEMKTVAGFINYKICRLTFQSKPSDAISQFRRHIEFFSNLVGMPQLAFEHEAWMSKQFEILGDLFQEAIQLSLTALMIQHPGLYYQEAARHAIARRELCNVLCARATDRTAEPSSYTEDASIPISESASIDEITTVPERAIVYSPTSVSLEPQRGKKSSTSTAVELMRAQSPHRFARRSPSTPASPITRSPPSSGQLDTVVGGGVSATEKVDGLEFYGQRPWRQGIQSMEPPNAAKEREGILALQKAELAVDHSAIIILLLEQTHLQYKRYKAERMKLYPCVLMGSEYYRKGNYAKALSCYASVIGDYRRDRWLEIYTLVLQHIMKCAYFTVQLSAFVSAALELIGPNSQLSLSEKVQIQRILFQLFSREPPDAHQFVSVLGQMSEETKESWMNCLNSSSATSEQHTVDDEQASHGEKKNRSNCADLCTVVLEANRLNVCVECKVAFTQPYYTIDQPVQLAIFLKSYAPLPLGVSRVTVEFTHSITNTAVSEMGSDRAYTRTSTNRTVQSWIQPFNLDSSVSFQMILLSLDSETLGQQVKVDSIHIQLTRPLNKPRASITDRSLVTLVWYWALADWPIVSHHTSRKAAETDLVHQPNSSTGSTLWNTNLSASKLERNPRPVDWDPVLSEFHDQYSSIQFPSIPPKWDLVGTHIHTQ
ncbi:Trafficking protein particle complex subunit 11 [Fasciolopsis buskii]|uniref:Trafficking protein particle complex subunit 11 n=1 Tax=Fasciolopsis buskii TaxID=27845 RepID=A0A8E0VKG9_9TREM|nr:Trafficking protein particle complex subunit 11 [Fasciolopsis buski]